MEHPLFLFGAVPFDVAPDDVKKKSPRPHDDPKKRTAQIARRLRPLYRPSDNDLGSFTDTLVATILSQNTSDVNSHRAYIQLRATYPTWAEVAAADPDELADVIRSGGLAAQKSRTIISALGAIHDRFGTYEPESFDEAGDDELLAMLTGLKGVGLKTAACVLMFALDRDVCAVDTHVHRVANRLGIVSTATADKTFHDLRPLIPKGVGRSFHVSLIRFGRTICKAQRPHCYECPVYDLCRWELKEEFAAARQPGPRPVSGDLMLLDIINGLRDE